MTMFLKTLDKDFAEELSSLGYEYIIEKTNNEIVYVFILSISEKESLMSLLQGKFNNIEYVFENTLSF